MALVDDLFFRARIEAVARNLGVGLEVVRNAAELERRMDAGGVTRVVVDLGLDVADPPTVIRALKARAAPPEVVAYGSHVDADRLAAARDAGADRVLARSAFTRRLPEILAGA